MARRRKPQTGDVLRIPIGSGEWLFGRVVSTNAWPSAFDDSWSDAIMLYVFRYVSTDGVPPFPLRASDLLFPPMICTHELWQSKGRCEFIENRAFEPGELLARHCFENAFLFDPPRYFDGQGEQLACRTEPCGVHAATTLHGIEVAIRDALGRSPSSH
jgi:hypothetical protein